MLTFNRVCREISCGLFGFLGFVFFGLGSSLCSSLVTLVFLGLVLLFERLLGCLLFFHCFPDFLVLLNTSLLFGKSLHCSSYSTISSSSTFHFCGYIQSQYLSLD